jgi:uncharacterized membrane protein YphA (DoxX/SURF4 family)
MATQTRSWAFSGLQSTGGERHLIIPRAVAGLPLLLIGLMHVFDSTAPMRPIVEAANIPAAAVLSPIGVAAEIVAGTLLLLGLYARLGGLIAIPAMLVAVYAHIVIDVWPNTAQEEPPLALPLVVMACAAYVLVRGAGAWSLDRRFARDRSNVRS